MSTRWGFSGTTNGFCSTAGPANQNFVTVSGPGIEPTQRSDQKSIEMRPTTAFWSPMPLRWECTQFAIRRRFE